MTMLLPTVEAVMAALRDAQLLRADELERVRREFPADVVDPQELGKWLIRQGFLTLYQARKLIQGKVSELVVGPYLIVDKLGEGGMGKVYRAVQSRMGRTVALKVVRAELLTNLVTVRRFQREARSAAQLSHPNIVKVFDAGQTGDDHWLALEYVDGVDLAKLVKSQGPLPVATTCDYIRQVALGLQHAHECNIIHRDIKPGNILVDKAGVVKVLDMGLARSQFTDEGADSVTALTQDGTVVGTPDFMAPEQAKNSSTVDHRADLYSLGCTWFYLLTGQTLFPTGTTLEKLLKHQMDPPPPLKQFRPDVPIAVEAVLWRLLAKNPADRWRSAGELADALGPMVGLPMPPAALPIAEAVEVTPTEVVPTASLTGPTTSRIAAPSPFAFAAREEAPPKRSPTKVPAKAKVSPVAWVAAVGGIALLVIGLILATKSRSVEPTSKSEPPAPAPPTKSKSVTPPVEIPFTADRYFPDDASAMITVRLDKLLTSELFSKHLIADAFPLLKELGPLDPRLGIDRVTVVLPSDDPSSALFVVQGKSVGGPVTRWLHSARDSEAEFDAIDRKVALFEFAGKNRFESKTFFVAVVNPTTLLMSPKLERLADAILRDAHPRRAGAYRDKSFATAVPNLDRNAAMWGFMTSDHSIDGKRLRDENVLLAQVRAEIEKELVVEIEIEGRNRPAVVDFLVPRQTALQLYSLKDKKLAPLGEFLATMNDEVVSKGKPFRMRFRYEWPLDKLAGFLRTLPVE